MAAPVFKYVQFTTAWTSGAATVFSTPSTGATIGNITSHFNLSSSPTAQGVQTGGSYSSSNPVTVGQNSYEFAFGLLVVGAADNSLSDMRVWFNNPAMVGVDIYAGTIAGSAFTVPVKTNSAIAVTNITSLTSPSSSVSYIHVTPPSNVYGAVSDPIYIQARVARTATGGSQAGMPTISVSIDWA